MKNKIWLIGIVFMLFTVVLRAEVVLPNIFTDNMVLQRNTEVLLWGWGGLNEEVTITTSWNDKVYTVTTPLTTQWKLSVSTPEAGGPFNIKLKGQTNELLLRNIMIGEVWLCSSIEYGMER